MTIFVIRKDCTMVRINGIDEAYNVLFNFKFYRLFREIWKEYMWAIPAITGIPWGEIDCLYNEDRRLMIDPIRGLLEARF